MMRYIPLREEDLEERFVRAGGPGGQNVNKVATCVILHHRPTGLEVRVQQERSQAQNRLLARRLLAAKLETRRLARLNEERRRLEKLRRQKRLRPRRVKERILASKRLHSLKKRARRCPSADE